MSLKQLFGWRTLPLWMGGLLLAFVAARVLLVQPSNERSWKPEHSEAPRVEIEGDEVRVENVRNFFYHTADSFDVRFEDRVYDLASLETVWFVLSPFRDNWRGPAHSFLSFGFSDSTYVSISVEARKEVGESYSVWKGLLRNYELLYVIGDERDLVGLRAVHWQDDVYVYPVRARREQCRSLFVSMLERAEKLRVAPEFYNTALSNCTTNIYDAVKLLSPEDWSYSWKLQLPGYSDELVFEKGVLNTDLNLEAARERFRVNEKAVRFFTDSSFSTRIREP